MSQFGRDPQTEPPLPLDEVTCEGCGKDVEYNSSDYIQDLDLCAECVAKIADGIEAEEAAKREADAWTQMSHAERMAYIAGGGL